MPILPQFVGRRIAIHNGQHFVEIDVKPEMIGHYLGEFAVTRRGVTHSGLVLVQPGRRSTYR